MAVFINGEARELPESCTVAELLAACDLAEKPCAVEVNRVVVPKRLHAERQLHAGDSVEIVTLVGGG